MLQDAGEHGRDFDHPGNGPPEEMGQAFESADMMLDKRVLAVLGKPPRGFRLSQSCRVNWRRCDDRRFNLDLILRHADPFRFAGNAWSDNC